MCVLLYFSSLEFVLYGCDAGPRASTAKSLVLLDIAIAMESFPIPISFLAGRNPDLITPWCHKVKMFSNVQIWNFNQYGMYWFLENNVVCI